MAKKGVAEGKGGSEEEGLCDSKGESHQAEESCGGRGRRQRGCRERRRGARRERRPQVRAGHLKKERRQKKQKKERRERAKKSKRRTEKAPKRRGKGTLSVIDVARQFEAHDELLSSWRNIIMIVAHRYNYNRYLAFATSVSIAASTAGEWCHGAVRAKVAERGIWTVQLLRTSVSSSLNFVNTLHRHNA